MAWSFNVSPDSCNNPAHYEEYLRLSAMFEYQNGRGITRIMVDDEANKIAGFVTLRATSLLDRTEDKFYVMPSIEISELAVDARYERQGIGHQLVDLSILISDFIKESFVGVQYLMLCSDPYAVGFYEKCGFGLLDDYYNVLNDGWNDNCTPMFMRLTELHT